MGQFLPRERVGFHPISFSNPLGNDDLVIAAFDKTDPWIKNDYLAEIDREPGVKAAGLEVIVKDGAVTLTGYAASFGDYFPTFSI